MQLVVLIGLFTRFLYILQLIKAVHVTACIAIISLLHMVGKLHTVHQRYILYIKGIYCVDRIIFQAIFENLSCYIPCSSHDFFIHGIYTS